MKTIKSNSPRFYQILILVLILIQTTPMLAQDMNTGFKLLETGKFKKAESFFANVLADHPENKTALLCFGRATGLAGDPAKALNIFDKLIQEYPGDLEVMLNIAEGYLWQKDGKNAVNSYLQILSKDSTSFAATLGIANSYSMEKQYKSAYQFINKALLLQPGNPQAAVSKKYIQMGYANFLASEHHKYKEALELVNDNLTADPNDQESMSLKSNIFLVSGQFSEADRIYRQMDDPLSSLKGQSTALHLMNENKIALQKAAEAIEMSKEVKHADRHLEMNLHYVSALLWNNKIGDARDYIDSLINEMGTDPELIGTEAEVSMYEADFKKGAQKYTDYLAKLPKSFKGNLGKADAMHALGMDNEAYDFAFKTLTYYPGQKDATNFIKRLNSQHSPAVNASYAYGIISDGSKYKIWGFGGTASISPLLSFQASYSKKDFIATESTQSASSETITIGGARQLNQMFQVNASFSQIRIKNNISTSTNNRSNVKVSLQTRVSKSQNLTIGYFGEVQDFNAALLEKNLKISHFVVKNSFFWKLYSFGSYTEAYRSYYSDGNTRNLLFTSLYKNILRKPSIKAGLNFLMMSFAESKPLEYYSPEQFKQIEVFIGLEHKDKDFPVAIMFDIAKGYSFAENQRQSTWRTKLTLEREVKNLTFNVSGSYSSIVAALSNGFSHMEFKGTLIIRLASKPIFYQKVSR